MNNMELWDKVKQPPPDALKKITGGRLSGKTDISPQWRYQVMTEQFGVCGVDWKYEIDEVWLEPASEGQTAVFVKVLLYIKVDDKWSDPIPGIGGSMLIAKEGGGLHTNDEAYKMATTDALSVCMKMLGVGSDVYAGKWDGTKYTDEPARVPQKQPDVRQSAPIKGDIILTPAFPLLKDKYGVDFEKCWEHGDEWKINKNGGRYHKQPDGTFCNFNKLLPIGEVPRLKFSTSDEFKAWLMETEEEEWIHLTDFEQAGVLESILEEKNETVI